MSRVEKETGLWMIAFGADHATGSYVQIWVQPHNDRDCPAVVIDNLGVRLSDLEHSGFDQRSFPQETMRIIDETADRYAEARTHTNSRPNIDPDTITRLAVSLGFLRTIDRDIRVALN